MSTPALPTGADAGMPDQAGFGLVEVVVSMLLIGVLAIAFLPVLVQTARLASVNAERASATQLVVQQLEQVGALGSSCSAVKEFAATAPAPVASPRGELQAHLLLGVPATDVCAEPYLRVIPVQVWATRSGEVERLASADMLVFLDAP